MRQIDLENSVSLNRIATALEVQNAITEKQVKATILNGLLRVEGSHTYQWILDRANEIHSQL